MAKKKGKLKEGMAKLVFNWTGSFLCQRPTSVLRCACVYECFAEVAREREVRGEELASPGQRKW